VAAWACISDKSLKRLEKVQSRCLCGILGAKLHTSTDAVEVVANVTPVRLRIQELCTMEYVRLMQKPEDSVLGQLLRSSSVTNNKFTPMSYLKYLATSFHRITDNAEIAPEHKTRPQMIDLFEGGNVSQLNITSEAGTDCVDIANAVTHFISETHSSTVICFTDGATTDSEVGAGCAAAIVIPPGPDSKEIQATELLDKITDSIETELTGIAIALEIVIGLFTSGTVVAWTNTVILTHCKAALNIILESHVYGNYQQIIARIIPSLLKFHNMKCHISLGWIPSHAGIDYNEQADTLAKKALKDSPISAKGQLSLPACKKMVAKNTKRLWQQRWDHSTTGRVTYDLIRTVGRSTVFPSDRCCAISYCRLLLDDSTLNVHQFRAGLAQSKLCDCAQGVDDLQHFFFECKNYKTIRHDMIEWVQSILTLVDQHKRPNLSTSLLLAPSGYRQISSRVSGEILGCTFEFIGKSKRCL